MRRGANGLRGLYLELAVRNVRKLFGISVLGLTVEKLMRASMIVLWVVSFWNNVSPALTLQGFRLSFAGKLETAFEITI